MAASEADTGYGIVLKKETATPGTYADFGLEITSIDAPGVSRSTQDASHMASPSETTEMIVGLKTTKSFGVQFNWVPAGTQDVLDAIDDGMVNWQILFPDASTCTVKAAITDFTISGLTPDGKMSASGTFTPSGPATWA